MQTDSVPADQWVHIILRDKKLYGHKLLRVNYTTYDVQREQDVLHVDTPQSNIMLLNNQYTAETRHTEHPYIYGKLLGIFHANVSFVGSLPDGIQRPAYQRIDFAWVHWYQFEAASKEFSLDTVSPIPLTSNLALGFVDPADILRAVHMIPRFSLGKLGEPVSKSPLVQYEHQWKAYFVNR